MSAEDIKKENTNQNINKPKEKPKLNFLNRKISFYVFQREKINQIKLKINNPETHNIDFADYQKIFFEDFANMATYNRGIFNRKVPQTPEVYKAKLHTEYDDLTITSIKDIKAYLNKENK